MDSPWWCSIEEQMEQVFLFVCMCPSSVASLLQNKIGFSFAMPKMKLDLCVWRPPTKSSFFFVLSVPFCSSSLTLSISTTRHRDGFASPHTIIGWQQSFNWRPAMWKWCAAFCTIKMVDCDLQNHSFKYLYAANGSAHQEFWRDFQWAAACGFYKSPSLSPTVYIYIWFCRTAAASRTTHTQIFAMRWVFVITSFFVGNFHSCIHKTYDGGDCWS